MTAAILLAQLEAKGVTVEADGGRLRLRPASALTAQELEAARALKPDLLSLLKGRPAPAWTPWPASLASYPQQRGPFGPCVVCSTGTWAYYGNLPFCRDDAVRRGAALVGYYEALRLVWGLTQTGAGASPATCKAAYAEVVRLTDDVGEPLASRLRHIWEVEWRRQTGRCPRCGEAEEFHDPEGAA